jgi:hypothetical protein
MVCLENSTSLYFKLPSAYIIYISSFVLFSYSGSQDIELDAILEDLSALESQFDVELKNTARQGSSELGNYNWLINDDEI